MIECVKGNLIDFAEEGRFNIIVHGCNCFNTFGSGLAKEIKQRYPGAYDADHLTIKGDRLKLGGYSSCLTSKRFTIINAYTQYDYGKDGKDRFEYDQFHLFLKKIARKYPIARYGFPKIGSGLAGGNWNRIEAILNEFSDSILGSVTVCEL